VIDIIYVIPAIAVTAAIIIAYKLGKEVGRHNGRLEQKARDRHPSSQYTKVRKQKRIRRNVVVIKGGK
jgi:hypothetical protein